MSLFSIVICSIDPWRFAQASLGYERLLQNTPHEIIGIHDALSLAEGYNRGVRRARGDIVIFSHDDLLILDPDFAQKIRRRLEDFDILGFAGTRRVIAENWWSAGLPWTSGTVAHAVGKKFRQDIWGMEPWPIVDGIQGIDGLCLMTRRETAEEIGFDEARFDDFHLYDLDFSFSAYLAGKKLGVCCDIPVIHASTGNYDEKHRLYGQRFIEKHQNALPADAKGATRIIGNSVSFSNFHALCAAWREDLLRRAWIACLRQNQIIDAP